MKHKRLNWKRIGEKFYNAYDETEDANGYTVNYEFIVRFKDWDGANSWMLIINRSKEIYFKSASSAKKVATLIFNG